MFENISLGWVAVGSIAGTLGIGAVILAVVNHYLNKNKDEAATQKVQQETARMEEETESLHLVNEEAKTNRIERAINVSERLLEKSQTYVEIIAQLKEDKFADRLRLERRDGIIEYQKQENVDLHKDIVKLSSEIAVMREQLNQIMKDLENVTQLNMQMRGILDTLQKEGKWDGHLDQQKI